MLDLDVTTISRVELEHVLIRCLELGHAEDVELIRAELASRVWQNHNPYATVVA